MIKIFIDPNITFLGPFTLSWHGFFTFVGVAVAVYLTVRYAKKVAVKDDVIYDIATWAILGGVIGARLVHVIDQWDFYQADPVRILQVWNGGIALYGGVLGGTLTGVLYAKIRGYPVGAIADVAAPAMLIGQAVGRIGDIINGEHFSTATDLPWGWVHTHLNSPAFGRPASHPAVAYEMIWDLIVFGILWKLQGRVKPNGMIFLIYLAAYSVGRFFISFVRLDKVIIAGLQEAQLIGILALIITVPIIVYKVQWVKEGPQPAEAGGVGQAEGGASVQSEHK